MRSLHILLAFIALSAAVVQAEEGGTNAAQADTSGSAARKAQDHEAKVQPDATVVIEEEPKGVFEPVLGAEPPRLLEPGEGEEESAPGRKVKGELLPGSAEEPGAVEEPPIVEEPAVAKRPPAKVPAKVGIVEEAVPAAVEGDQDVLIDDEEDVLILDDSEESILGDVRGDDAAPAGSAAQAKPGGGKAAEAGVDGAAGGGEAPSDEDVYGVDDREGVSAGKGRGKSSSAAIVPLAPAKVEDARSINFAKGLREYRSPRAAMLMSLVIPGLGQAYTKRAWRTAIYGVVEATIIGISINYAVKANRERDKAWAFADAHFDTTRFAEYWGALRNHLEAKAATDQNFSQLLTDYYQGDVDLMMNETYYYNLDSLRGGAYKDESFYDYVSGNGYVYGWEDSEPDFQPSGDPLFVATHGDTIRGDEYSYDYLIHNSDTTWLLTRVGKKDPTPLYGYSRYQVEYNNILSNHNALSKTSTNVLFLLVVNHLASAVDAFISAKAHNESLLGRESLWERIHLDQQMALTEAGWTTRVGVRYCF